MRHYIFVQIFDEKSVCIPLSEISAIGMTSDCIKLLADATELLSSSRIVVGEKFDLNFKVNCYYLVFDRASLILYL